LSELVPATRLSGTIVDSVGNAST